VSIDLVAAALWLEMEPRRQLVLVSLCENADDDGYCWPSQRYISRRTNLSIRSVIPHLRGLERDGWLVTLRRGRSGYSSNRRLAAARILEEGAARRASFREETERERAAWEQRAETAGRQGEETARRGTQGEDDVAQGEVDVGQGAATSRSRVKLLRKEPSANRQLEPSVIEPSSHVPARGKRDVVLGRDVTNPEDLEEKTPEDVVLGTLTRLSAGFDPDRYDLEERRSYWAQRIPGGQSKMLDGMFKLIALNGRKWSAVEVRLEAAELAGWPPDKTWSPKPKQAVEV
jgi:DNA-binding PadR family transcriptional regulator